MCGKFLYDEWCLCLCVSGMCVVELYVVNDAICLVLAVGYVTLVLFEAVKKEERSVMYVKTVPFALMCIDVCDYPIYLLCAFLCF